MHLTATHALFLIFNIAALIVSNSRSIFFNFKENIQGRHEALC